MHRSAAVAPALVLVAALGAGAGEGDIRIGIEGFRNPDGKAICRLFNEGPGFPDEDGRVLGAVVAPIVAGRAVCVFAGVPPGRYAIAAAHDENGNWTLDEGFLGLPTEGFGFSGGASAGLTGAPDFDEAAFAFDGATVELETRLTYL